MSQASILAKDVMLALASVGIQSLVVGGCPRDLIHGNEPKDIDVIVHEDVDEDRLKGAMQALMSAIHGTRWAETVYEHYDESDVLTEEGGDKEDELELTRDFSTRVHKVIKYGGVEGYPIDILFVRNSTLTDGKLASFVDTFDFSINRRWIDVHGNFYNECSKDAPIEIVGDLKPTKRAQERYTKLSSKYPQYDWTNVRKFLYGV